jgi:hypothetical protein
MEDDPQEPAQRPLLKPELVEALFAQRREAQADDAAFAGRANRRFLRFNCNPSRRWPGVAWINQPDGGRHYSKLGSGKGWKVPPMCNAETPRFRTRSRKASNLADLCEFDSSFWLLASARCAEVFARMQPEAVDILPVEVELGDGTVLPAGHYNMVDIINVLPAYDLQESGLWVETDEYASRYRPSDYSRIILRDEVVAGHHLFRDRVDRTRIWVSVEIREALRKAKVTSATYAWPDRVNSSEFYG